MPRIERPVGYRVVIVEYERGWGSRVDETLYFDNEAEAREYAEKFNSTNPPVEIVPDWYMVAEYRGAV